MTQHTKKGSGGKRDGSGRKLLYGEHTVTISFVVPGSKKTEIIELVDAKLEEYRVKG